MDLATRPDFAARRRSLLLSQVQAALSTLGDPASAGRVSHKLQQSVRGNFDTLWTISRVHIRSIPLHTCCPYFVHADWCLQSDVMTNSHLQAMLSDETFAPDVFSLTLFLVRWSLPLPPGHVPMCLQTLLHGADLVGRSRVAAAC